MSRVGQIRYWALIVVLAAGLGAVQGRSQNAPQGNSTSSGDNPFPDEPKPKVAPEEKKQAGQAGQPLEPESDKATPTGSKGKATSDNPFPGEDSNAPIIPVDPRPWDGAAGRRPGNSGSDPARGGSEDPVRSPDGAGPGGSASPDDGFSSSRSGVGSVADDTTADAPAGKPVKIKTRAQQVKEDVDVGGFYLEKHDWKGAEARFESAFKLDGENEEAVWGMAEAERHLNLLDKAREHYELFLSYDPDGPHSKAARKGLEQVEAGRVK